MAVGGVPHSRIALSAYASDSDCSSEEVRHPNLSTNSSVAALVTMPFLTATQQCMQYLADQYVHFQYFRFYATCGDTAIYICPSAYIIEYKAETSCLLPFKRQEMRMQTSVQEAL